MHSSLNNYKKIFKKTGIEITSKNNLLFIDTTFTNIRDINVFRNLIYSFLNNTETRHFITILNTPYCLLPEATDHISHNFHSEKKLKKLKICKRCKFNPSCPGISKLFKKWNGSLQPVKDLPEDICIEVNNLCNLNCSFCRYPKNNYSPGPGFNKIKSVISEAGNLGIKQIRFTGGEPLLRKDLPKMLEFAKKKGFYVFLNTNATLLDQKTLNAIQGYVDNLLISICGYDFFSEKKLTSRNDLFIHRISNIIRAKQSLIPTLRIGTVISKLLLKNFSKYISLINRLKINTWELYRPMIPYKQLQADSPFNLSKNNILKILPKLSDFKKLGMNVYIANAIPFCITKNYEYMTLFKGSKFDDGHSRLVFDHKGIFKPSYFNDINLGRTITTSWNNPFIKKINSLEYLPQTCKKCNYLSCCLGGSRYMANQHYGNFFFPDPYIAFNK